MPLVFTLAFRNLFHDRLRFIATVIGIVFSIVLVTVQMGLYLGLRTHGDDDDRSCVRRPLDHAARHQVLRGSIAAGHARALPRAFGQRRGRRDSRRDRICGLANTERRDDPGFRHRFGPACRRPAAVEPGGRPDRGAIDPERGRSRQILFRSARRLGDRRDRRDPPAGGAGGGRHQRHPFVHHDAVRFHGRRSGAGSHRRSVRARPPIFLVRLEPGCRSRSRSPPAHFEHCRRRGADHGRVSRTQPHVLAVRHRRRRCAVRRRVARRDRRHRHRRADALFQHEGAPERVRHPARHRFVRDDTSTR